MPILWNLTSKAPWSARLYSLQSTVATYSPMHGSEMHSPVSGIGGKLITISAGRMQSKLFAVYFLEKQWYAFLADEEFPFGEIISYQVRSLFVFAQLSLVTRHRTKRILYIRPMLRKWFEDGWTLSDIDMAFVLKSYIENEDARLRLMETLSGKL